MIKEHLEIADVCSVRHLMVRAVVAVGLVGSLMAAILVLSMVRSASPACCNGWKPYVTLYDRERDHVEALLVSGDGQAFAALAQDPTLAHPEVIDEPGEYSYRAQRPLWGYLAWGLSLGQSALVGWALVALTILSCGAACGVAAALALERGASPWWGLVAVLAGIHSLSELTPELLAFAFLGGGVLLWERRHRASAVTILCLAVAARETMLVGVVALALASVACGIGPLRARLRWVVPLVVPFVTCGAWAALLRVRLGSWPTGSSQARLGFPLSGLLESATKAPSVGLLLGLALLVLAVTVSLTVAPRDPITWIVVGFALFATTFAPVVWTTAGVTRSLVPAYVLGAINVAVAVTRRRADSARPALPSRVTSALESQYVYRSVPHEAEV